MSPRVVRARDNGGTRSRSAERQECRPPGGGRLADTKRGGQESRFLGRIDSRVVGGRVRTAERTARTPSYHHRFLDNPVLHRCRPGAGYRHVLRKADLLDFIRLLPDWDELSDGLDAIVLARAEHGVFGYHVPGIVSICAFPRDLRVVFEPWAYQEDEHLLVRLGVACTPTLHGMAVQFDEKSARGFQLLGVFLHELGHHHDRMTNRSRCTARGEPYADAYARAYEDRIWEAYAEAVGD